ncbi:hypothetical protein [Pseudomonas entomophila]|uniref:Uncharacterized protein n=2 Tax=Pseudomonas entomophila TaxID=312306 RepID=Q1I9N6_PSEE4|nr:hypothetical protein [Pseudomonas entomophila]WMW03619.1 hypothetical protein RAH46_14825 [Pseudomonas entomophila]CAK15639.1 hypothetical protein PSEEN2862 [Pseudomonas entomophila L48]
MSNESSATNIPQDAETTEPIRWGFIKDHTFIQPETIIPCTLAIKSIGRTDMLLAAYGKRYLRYENAGRFYNYNITMASIDIEIPEHLLETARLAVSLLSDGRRYSSLFQMTFKSGKLYTAKYIMTGTIPNISPPELQCPFTTRTTSDMPPDCQRCTSMYWLLRERCGCNA